MTKKDKIIIYGGGKVKPTYYFVGVVVSIPKGEKVEVINDLQTPWMIVQDFYKSK